jgi:hypothetical protein
MECSRIWHSNSREKIQRARRHKKKLKDRRDNLYGFISEGKKRITLKANGAPCRSVSAFGMIYRILERNIIQRPWMFSNSAAVHSLASLAEDLWNSDGIRPWASLMCPRNLAVRAPHDSDIRSGIRAAELDMVRLQQISAYRRELELAAELPIESSVPR